MTLQAFVAYLAAAFFVFYGLAFVIAPNAMAALITGNVIDTPSGLIDFRATYGGMAVAVGLLIYFLYRKQQVVGAMNATAIVLFCMAAARTLGFVLDGSPNVLMILFLVLEIAGGLLALFARRLYTQNEMTF